jgi:hypothetical protein
LFLFLLQTFRYAKLIPGNNQLSIWDGTNISASSLKNLDNLIEKSYMST